MGKGLKVILGLVFPLLLSAQPVRKLVMSVGGKWPPYHYTTNTGVEGLDITVTREILKTTGYELEVKLYPAPRGQAYLKTGEVDLLSGASYNQERNEYARFSIPYRDEALAILVRKGTAKNWPMTRLIDAKRYPKLRIAVARGGWYGPQYEEVLQDPAVASLLQPTPSIESRLQMLASGHADMVIDDGYAMAWTAKSLGLAGRFERHPLQIPSGPIHLMFSRISVDASIVDQINLAIKALKQSGRLEELLSSYQD